jgi:hypothetical protein
MSYTIQWIAVFLILAVADVCWTYYFIKISERKSVEAGIWGSAIYLCSAFGILSYTEDRTLVIPAVLGSFLGTYLTVEYKKHKEKHGGKL